MVKSSSDSCYAILLHCIAEYEQVVVMAVVKEVCGRL
jgi:hypothetical protein